MIDFSELSPEEVFVLEREKIKTPYRWSYLLLKSNLMMLAQLNRELPKSIRHMKEERKKVFRERVAKLKNKSGNQFDELVEFLESSLESGKASKGSGYVMPVTEKTGALVQEAFDAVISPTLFNEFIRDMSLVYLVAEFESFLQDILRTTFQRRPEALASSEKSITIEELIKFKDIKNVRQRIMEKEIQSVVNQDLGFIEAYLERKFRLKLPEFDSWKKFKERFYRRNIIIHNSGKVNRLYRQKTGYKGKTKKMVVSQEYLEESILLFFTMSFNISAFFSSKFKS